MISKETGTQCLRGWHLVTTILVVAGRQANAANVFVFSVRILPPRQAGGGDRTHTPEGVWKRAVKKGVSHLMVRFLT